MRIKQHEVLRILQTNPTRGQIMHQLFFWLKNPGNTDDRADLIAGLKG